MTIYSDRARFVPVENGFNIKRPPIEPQAFVDETNRAFIRGGPTGFIALDLSKTLGTAYAATTPFLLTRYLRINAGETVENTFDASGELWAVLSGSGSLRRGGETIEWAAGDLLALPGGVATTWISQGDSVLWVTTDEPALSFAHVRPELGCRASIQSTHFRASDIAEELKSLYRRKMEPNTPGRAIFMATAGTETLGTCLPSLTLTLNAVRPGEFQRAHRHNAAAVVLVLRESKCGSTIGGQKFPWTRHVTLLTPAGEPHDHRNALEIDDDAITDEDFALSLIVQDGGLHYYARTMGFAFEEN